MPWERPVDEKVAWIVVVPAHWVGSTAHERHARWSVPASVEKRFEKDRDAAVWAAARAAHTRVGVAPWTPYVQQTVDAISDVRRELVSVR